ncbi:hypothetical protein [Lentzea tibetensis]|uniref:hypothetical protein n=1 Tax=Lentzea tibetensis TaxID=2591470 RepID=UPI0016493A9F|nr:hypothetical protein [Lentzea tibetensis]
MSEHFCFSERCLNICSSSAGLERLSKWVVAGSEVVLEFGVSELVDRADSAKQTKAMGVVQERHQRAWWRTSPCQLMGGNQVRHPSVVFSSRKPKRDPYRKRTGDPDCNAEREVVGGVRP